MREGGREEGRGGMSENGEREVGIKEEGERGDRRRGEWEGLAAGCHIYDGIIQSTMDQGIPKLRTHP